MEAFFVRAVSRHSLPDKVIIKKNALSGVFLSEKSEGSPVAATAGTIPAGILVFAELLGLDLTAQALQNVRIQRDGPVAARAEEFIPVVAHRDQNRFAAVRANDHDTLLVVIVHQKSAFLSDNRPPQVSATGGHHGRAMKSRHSGRLICIIPYSF